MQIRAALATEAGELTQIAFSAKAYWGYSNALMEIWRSNLIVSAESIHHLPSFVAEVHGRIAGFYQLKTTATPWELDHLWVRPEYMRQGIGRALLAHATQQAMAAGVPVLAIDSDPNAECFYLACGAHRVGSVAAPLAGNQKRIRPLLEICSQQPRHS